MNFNNKIEVLVNLFTYDKGEIKVLLFKKQDDPFKGYWMLPSNLLLNKETIEECANATLKDKVGFNDIYLDTCSVFSALDRIPEVRIVGISLIGIIDTVNAEMSLDIKGESKWFNINNIPKTIYDNSNIINDTISNLKKQILNTKLLKVFFPGDFTLPELQKLFEQALNKELDRRNFRKKIIKMDIIEDTMDKNITMTGRPAKLYKFKDIEDKDLF